MSEKGLDIEVMKPLYPPEGAPVCGYVCCDRSNGIVCRSLTRTKRGMWAHLRIVHGIKRQGELKFNATSRSIQSDGEEIRT